MIADEVDRKELHGDLRLIARRAMSFQEFLTRRAWGFFYAVWAVDFLIIVIASIFFYGYLNSLIFLVAIITGYFVSKRIYKIAKTVPVFRNSIEVGDTPNVPGLMRRLFLVALIADVCVFSAIVLFIGKGMIADYAGMISSFTLIFLAGIGTFISSLRGIGWVVPENVLATIALLSGGISLLLAQIYKQFAGYEFFAWILVAAFWIISSLLSFRYASVALGGLNAQK